MEKSKAEKLIYNIGLISFILFPFIILVLIWLPEWYMWRIAISDIFILVVCFTITRALEEVRKEK